jgi:hypothetical protein
MIRIFKLIILLVISQVAFGQAPSNYTNINGRYRWIAGMFDSTFHIPKGATPSLRTGGSTNAGAVFYNTSDSSVYTYTGTQWIKLRGTIIDTTSLSNRINLKLNISDTASMLSPYLRKVDTTNKFVTQVYKKNGSDSVFYVKGGVHTWAFNDSTGSPGGGGGGKIYYFNGGVSMGTFGGFTMYELGDTANTGTAANFTRATTGNIANFITDPGKPGLLQIPAGVWSIDAYLSETGGGSNNAEIYVQVEKWDGSTITTIATSPIEQITNGSVIDLYSWSVSIPTTALAVTDRIIIQFYIQNTNGKTVTLYTQNGYVGEVHTTFTTGIGAINGLTAPAQYLVTGTSGTDFNINSATATHTFNLPTASSTNRGALSSTDWTTFNNKGSVSSVATNTATGITGGTITTTGTLAIDTLLISTRAWRQKGVDSVASLINTRVSGTTNYIPKFTSSSAIGNSVIYEASGSIGINSTSPTVISGFTTLSVNNATQGGMFETMYNGTPYGRFFAAGGAGYVGLLSVANVPLLFGVNDTEQMRLTSTGLGIGTSSNTEAAKLNVQGGYIFLKETGGGDIYFRSGYGGSNPAIQVTSASPLLFLTSNVERMRLDASGNLGIGTSSPAYKLDVNGNAHIGTGDSRLIIGDVASANTESVIWLRTGSGKYAYSIAAQSLADESLTIARSTTQGGTTFTTASLTLNSSGNLGLGVTPSAWTSVHKVIQFGAVGSIETDNDAVALSNNRYFDGTNRYTTNDFASIFVQANGQHIWYTAPSGTAGNAISFTQAMTLDASGNLALGTTASLSSAANRVDLTINGSSTSMLTFGVNGTRRAYLISNGTDLTLSNTVSGATIFSTNDTERMRITSSGNVGIGTTNPEELLELSSSNTTGGQLLMESTGSATDSYAGMRFKIAGGSDGGYEKAGIFAIRGSGGFNDLSLIFATNTAADATNVTSANERMRITGAGNVGIGTTSPSEKLDISGTGDVKAIVQTTSSGSGANTALGVKTAADGNWLIQTGNAISSGLRFYDVTNSAERMRITSGGDVLIGLTSGARLSVRDAGGNDTHFGLGANYDNYITAGSSGVTIFRNATTERMRITSGGELLINTTSDAGDYKLQVNGNTLTSGSITTAAPTGGTAKPWKLGEAGVSVGGANTTAVKVEIDGVVYYLLTAYLPEPAPESAPKPKPEG